MLSNLSNKISSDAAKIFFVYISLFGIELKLIDQLLLDCSEIKSDERKF